jgi:hypothetical protein
MNEPVKKKYVRKKVKYFVLPSAVGKKCSKLFYGGKCCTVSDEGARVCVRLVLVCRRETSSC